MIQLILHIILAIFDPATHTEMNEPKISENFECIKSLPEQCSKDIYKC